MKVILLIGAIVIYGSGFSQSKLDTAKLFKQAILLIEDRATIDAKHLRNGKFNIANSILRFEILEPFFFSSQNKVGQSSTGSALSYRVKFLETPYGKSKKYVTKIFFSEIKNSFFFAEIVQMKDRFETNYQNRPDFGKTEIFLFQIEGDKVNLIKSRQLAYN